VVIMTSNLGSTHILDADLSADELRDRVMRDVRGHFRPEFLNRIDETVIFDRLDREQLREIVDIQLARLRSRLDERDLSLTVSDAAMERLAELGYDPLYGARPLKRVIRTQLEDPLARAMLAGEVAPGQEIVAEVDDDGSITVSGRAPQAA
jgi:ATP-dependent Clp protease ATP-binding subunit ClpB